MQRHILIPLDQSAFSERALAVVPEIAKAGVDKLTLLEVVPSIRETIITDSGRVISPAEQIAAYEGRGQVYLETHAQALRKRGYAVKVATDVGVPAEAIVDHACIHNIDMIVMCTHGHTGLTQLLRGSVANAVLAHSPCPVLLVPAHAEKAEPAPIAA